MVIRAHVSLHFKSIFVLLAARLQAPWYFRQLFPEHTYTVCDRRAAKQHPFAVACSVHGMTINNAGRMWQQSWPAHLFLCVSGTFKTKHYEMLS